uniref:Uncharacterized protein n=1 Tax=Timema tahoe TaxID=61484 RepID=A0A7R9NW62_9NEOP|nr:unnamed protein product [Timema tahoe]
MLERDVEGSKKVLYGQVAEFDTPSKLYRNTKSTFSQIMAASVYDNFETELVPPKLLYSKVLHTLSKFFLTDVGNVSSRPEDTPLHMKANLSYALLHRDIFFLIPGQEIFPSPILIQLTLHMHITQLGVRVEQTQ